MNTKPTINHAVNLALALSDIKPTDLTHLGQWRHIVRCSKELLGEQIELLDLDKWEALCYPPDDAPKDYPEET